MFNLWIIIMILLAITELLTVYVLAMWFSVGALVAFISSFFIDNFLIQFAIFAIIGTVLLITIRPVLNKKIKNKLRKFNRVKSKKKKAVNTSSSLIGIIK